MYVQVVEGSCRLIHECRSRLSVVLPMNGDELEFLRRLNDEGEIAPELLTADANLRTIIGGHPMLQWKAINVRQHRALPPAAEG